MQDKEEIILNKRIQNGILKVNNHIHSPYSFCSFENIEQIFQLAGDEDIKVLGINDFNTTGGYEDFSQNGKKYKIYPLFNIEFIGLLSDLQEKNIRVNDPDNPGRTYFCGKGLNFPVRLKKEEKQLLKKLAEKTQEQVKEIIKKVDNILVSIDDCVSLDYDKVKKEHARDLVRERHIARAIRKEVYKHYKTTEKKQLFFNKLFSGNNLSSNIEDEAAKLK